MLKKLFNIIFSLKYKFDGFFSFFHTEKDLYISSSDIDAYKVDSGLIELISDDDLARLNNMLSWKCFTADTKGRRFGNKAWKGKRDTAQLIPDPRILEMDRLFTLKDKTVLEVGCFEGVHTIGLAKLGARVYAVDSRIENVVKTLIRTKLFGYTADISLCNLELSTDMARLPSVNIMHHVGVLYHLKDPVSHLLALGTIVNDGMLLCTHYAMEDMLSDSYMLDGKEYRYFKYLEKGRDDFFSGMYDHSKWLLIEDIKYLLAQSGFTDFRIMADEQQRNGPRVTLFAGRPGRMKDPIA